MRRRSGGRVRGGGPETHGGPVAGYGYVAWWSAKEEAEKRGTEESWVDGGEGGRRMDLQRGKDLQRVKKFVLSGWRRKVRDLGL